MVTAARPAAPLDLDHLDARAIALAVIQGPHGATVDTLAAALGPLTAAIRAAYALADAWATKAQPATTETKAHALRSVLDAALDPQQATT